MAAVIKPRFWKGFLIALPVALILDGLFVWMSILMWRYPVSG